jgi:hypothetical protein
LQPTLHSRRHFGSAKPDLSREIAIHTGPTPRRPIRLYRRSLPPRTASNFEPIFCTKKSFVFKVPIFVH